MNNIDKKWYQRSVWIIIFLIFFFPVGLFLMWKYSNWNKIVKGTISGFLALVTVIALFSPKVQPEKIEISIANYQDEYDVNTNIALTATFYPENSTTTVTYHSTGKNITFSGSRLNTGTVEGIYEVYAIAGGKKSNTLSITVVDMAAKKAEGQRLAEEKAAKEAEEQRLAEEKVAKEAEEQRLAEEKAAKEAEEQRLAEEKAAKEAEEQRLAEEKAVKEGSTAQNKDNDSENGDNFNTYDNEEQQNTSFSYVLNTNTRRFHYSSCGNVKKIAPKNYATSNDSRSDLIAQGYKPCGVCKP